jgi:hypothetical protein
MVADALRWGREGNAGVSSFRRLPLFCSGVGGHFLAKLQAPNSMHMHHAIELTKKKQQANKPTSPSGQAAQSVNISTFVIS